MSSRRWYVSAMLTAIVTLVFSLPAFAQTDEDHFQTLPFNFSNPGANGVSPKDIGAVGGNVGLLDGSVSWKPIKQMKQYRGWSSPFDNECLALW